MTITDTATFLAECNSLGIVLSAADGNVHCRAPRGKITEKIRTTISANKKEILTALAAAGDGELPTFPPAAATAAVAPPATPAAFAQQPPPPAFSTLRHRQAAATPQPRSCEPWPAAVDQAAAFALLLTADDIPVNLILRPWEKVTNREKFLQTILAGVTGHAAGQPTHGELIGDLQARLLALRSRLIEPRENNTSPPMKFAA